MKVLISADIEGVAGLTQQRLLQRPEQSLIDRAFAELLQNIQLSHCTTNLGYVHALIPPAR